MDSHDQIRQFDNLWDELTFNIFIGKPDSLILPFLTNHFPYLAKPSKSEPGDWTIYPPDLEVPQKGMHSL